MKRLLLFFAMVVVIGLPMRADNDLLSDFHVSPLSLHNGVSRHTLLPGYSDIMDEDDDDARYMKIYEINVSPRCGGTYTFTLGGEFDTYLILMDEALHKIDENDDINLPEETDGYRNHSQIIANLTPGTYYLIVTSYYSISNASDDNNIGNYTLTATCHSDLPAAILEQVDFDSHTLHLDRQPQSLAQSSEEASQLYENEEAYIYLYRLASDSPVSSRLNIEGENVVGAIVYRYEEGDETLSTIGLFSANESPILLNLDDEDLTDYQFYMALIASQPDGGCVLSATPSGILFSLTDAESTAITSIEAPIEGQIDIETQGFVNGYFDFEYGAVHIFTPEIGTIFEIAYDDNNEGLNWVVLSEIDREIKPNDEGKVMWVGDGSSIQIVVIGDGDALYDEDDHIDYTLTIAKREPLTLYIDAENGDDDNDGLTAQSPLATLNKAVAASGGTGRYYLMGDITLTEDIDGGMGYYAELLPYSNDITITIQNQYGFIECNYILIGDSTGAYRTTIINGALDNNVELLSCYALRMYYTTTTDLNCALPIFAFVDAEIKHCVFENNRANFLIIAFQKASISNCRFSDNDAIVISNIAQDEEKDFNYTLIDDTITYNTVSTWCATIYLSSQSHHGQVLIDGGQIGGNQMNGNVPIAGNLARRELGNIQVSGDIDLTLGPRFSMGNSDYVLLSDGATVCFQQAPEADIACTILPIHAYIDENAEALACNTYYRSGLTVVGNGGRYRSHVAVAQLDNGTTWYISNSGQLTTTEPEPEPIPEGIADVNGSSVAIYPNPAVAQVAVDCAALADAKTLRLTTVLGQTVAEQPADRPVLNVANLPAGIYMLQVLDSNGHPIAVHRLAKK